MNQADLKAKLAWQCRRGMLELDVILLPFFQQHFEQMNSQQQADFTLLLEEADPDLYTWLMGYGKSDSQVHQQMIEYIRDKMEIGN